MSILFLLIPLALILLAIAVWFFVWSVRNGQFEDMEGPAYRILMDDDDPLIPKIGEPENKAEDNDSGVRNETK
ncbi:MAG: cbb3-type cytochrome oxidase assembly protein CcoS [gamma proteobacterium symbiont of Bathyaustriella thionipta]|nr:cbb3-type cytochrome oxidase assembly protein CcoS [gamma proteobacterium symbiont of Bathyaustriella thionipta]